MPLYSYNTQHKIFARSLRRSQTEAEKLLWSKLRSRQLNGYKFRRQQPIGQYILDFYCEEKKLAIELDGGQHNTPNEQKSDQIRTEILKNEGYTILRFWNNDVLSKLEDVLEVISKKLIS